MQGLRFGGGQSWKEAIGTMDCPISHRVDMSTVRPKTENNGKTGLPIPFISSMGRGPGNFGLQLAGFASRLGLSRCEDGNSGTQKTRKKQVRK